MVIILLLIIALLCVYETSSLRSSSLRSSSLRSSSLRSSSLRSSSSVTRLQAKGGGGGRLPTDKILNSLVYHGMQRDIGSAIIEKAENALKSWTTEYTEFLDPLEIKSLVEGFKGIVDIKLRFQGGYSQSIRKRCFIDRNDDYTETIDDVIDENDDEQSKKVLTLNEYTDNIEQYIAAIKIEGNFLFDRASHDDFQTAIMATGVSKSQIGDIIVLPNDKGAQVIITPDVTLNIINELKQMRTVPVTIEEIELKDISKRMAQVKMITCIEASTRLDAVASAVFGISRSKTVKLIDNNSVMVNWKINNNSAYPLKIGEEVSLKDGGKLFIANIETTAKGRYRITAQRFL